MRINRTRFSQTILLIFPEGARVRGCEGANLDRHLVPYHGKQGESNLASSLFIYLFICLFIYLYASTAHGPRARHRNFGPGK